MYTMVMVKYGMLFFGIGSSLYLRIPQCKLENYSTFGQTLVWTYNLVLVGVVK